MRQTYFLIVALVLLMAVLSFAQSTPKSCAIGLQGVGTEWSTGNLTFQKYISPIKALDITPTFGISRQIDSDERSIGLGLNIGIIKILKASPKLHFGT